MSSSHERGYFGDSSSFNDDDTITSFPIYNGLSFGLNEWTIWRRNLNATMIDVMKERERVRRYNKENSGNIVNINTYHYLQPSVVIKRELSSYVISRAQYEKSDLSLGYSSFLSFGIPRVHLTSPITDITQSMDSNTSATSRPETVSSDETPQFPVRRRRYRKRNEY